MSRVKTAEHKIVVPFNLSAGQDVDFYRHVEEVAAQGPRSIDLDCSSLDPVHSSHIGLLWIARDICAQESVEISLENVNNSLIRTLQMLDLADIFEINEADIRWPVVATSVMRPSRKSEQHSGDFRVDTAGIDLGLHEFMELLDEWQLDEVIKFDLRTLFYEVANNIVCHSGLTTDARVQYRVACANGELQLVFEDNGKPFNPLSLSDDFDPETAARNRQTRGFGINLIRRISDDIEYTHRDNTTNVLSLTKRYGDG